MQLRLLDFEDAQESFREVHRAYAKESKADTQRAELLRENRLVAIVMNFSKTDVRLIEADFRDRYLEHRLPDELKAAPAATRARNSRYWPCGQGGRAPSRCGSVLH